MHKKIIVTVLLLFSALYRYYQPNAFFNQTKKSTKIKKNATCR